jgi:hypothetical protein
MNSDAPHHEIMNGLTTKSSKVRVLAQAGYDRAQISKNLDIRYGHVRNVLLQSLGSYPGIPATKAMLP